MLFLQKSVGDMKRHPKWMLSGILMRTCRDATCCVFCCVCCFFSNTRFLRHPKCPIFQNCIFRLSEDGIFLFCPTRSSMLYWAKTLPNCYRTKIIKKFKIIKNDQIIKNIDHYVGIFRHRRITAYFQQIFQNVETFVYLLLFLFGPKCCFFQQ